MGKCSARGRERISGGGGNFRQLLAQVRGTPRGAPSLARTRTTSDLGRTPKSQTKIAIDFALLTFAFAFDFCFCAFESPQRRAKSTSSWRISLHSALPILGVGGPS